MDLLLSGSLDSFFKLISSILIFIFVVAITYFTTYWMAGFQKKKSTSKNLKVIETVNVGSNKFVSIIEAGTEYLVVSIGKDEVRLLTKLTKEQLTDLSFETDINPVVMQESFQQILDKIKDKIPKSRNKNE